jgi:hypothetical protein
VQDASIFETACTSLLRRGDGEVRQRLRDAIRARVPERVAVATRLLALSGRQDDVALLVDGLGQAPTVAVVRALGRYGHPQVLPALIALLDSKDEALVPVVAETLDFVTNAGLRETVLVPWTPGVVPPDGSPAPARPVPVPIADRLAWEKWYAQAQNRLDPGVKLRGGLPFMPSMIADELESKTTESARNEAALELVIATGVGTRLATNDWVARQKQQLSELRSHLRSLGSAAGAWWFAGAAVTSR